MDKDHGVTSQESRQWTASKVCTKQTCFAHCLKLSTASVPMLCLYSFWTVAIILSSFERPPFPILSLCPSHPHWGWLCSNTVSEGWSSPPLSDYNTVSSVFIRLPESTPSPSSSDSLLQQHCYKPAIPSTFVLYGCPVYCGCTVRQISAAKLSL